MPLSLLRQMGRALRLEAKPDGIARVTPDGRKLKQSEVRAAKSARRKLQGKTFVEQKSWWASPLELVVQLPLFVPSANEKQAGSKMADIIATKETRKRRRGVHAVAMAAFREAGWELDQLGKVVGLRARIARVGFVRIAPDGLDSDNLLPAFKAWRDGAMDVIAGFKLDKRGKPHWRGQYIDGKKGVPCSYNEIEAGEVCGLQVLFFLKPEAK
ncbi:MAG: hypothetical protein ABW217_03970 [Polyangiaceae bacterium]